MMKKLTLLKLAIVLMIFNTSTFAQELKFGVVGGFDIANTYITKKDTRDAKYYNPKPSFNANIYLAYKSAKFFGLSIEPGFIQKGWIDKTGRTNNDNARIRLNYWQIPILVDIYLGEKFSISVGPEFTSMLNMKVKRKGSSAVDISSRHKNYDNDFSGIFGVNYKIRNNLDVGFKYSHSLKYLERTGWVVDGPGGESNQEVYNQYFQVFFRITTSKKL